MANKQGREPYKRLIVFTEVIILLAVHTVLFAILWNSQYKESIELPFFRRGNWAMIAIYPILMLLVGKLFGIFKLAVARTVDTIFSHIAMLFVVNLLMYFELLLLIRWHYPSIVPLLIIFLIESAYTIVWVFLVKLVNNRIYPPHDMVLIYGDYSPDDIIKSMNERGDRYHIRASVNINEGMNKIMAIIEEHEAVIISDLPATERNDVVKYCYAAGKRLYMLPKITDIIIRSSEELHVFDSPVLLNKNFGLTFDQRMTKRTLDIIVSGLMIILSGWLMIIIAILIKLDDHGPVFYRQERLTRDGKVFRIIKFRSMKVNAEEQGPQLSRKEDDRVTRVGRVLRMLHLDELPQLFNVFGGSMSMVGPRPERPEIMKQYKENVPEFYYRLKVKGGLTGYAQVYGKYNTTPYNKLRMDLIYIQNYSLWLDLKIIVQTVKILFEKENTEGIDQDQTTAIREEQEEEQHL
ncbi:MAG: exopolysaccharide biosynthesis polyprenyl glycosylphosphotransferase [Lachnospiraceae bacterium]|nr:exopolysaccharide biosynthesis polyprenyl glycosylphosphotransferase [Lachnospiraceae bacterium]